MNEQIAKISEELKARQAELKKLSAKRKAERTTDDALAIAAVKVAIANLKTQKQQAELDELTKNLARAKDEAFLKILHANNVSTERELKILFLLRNTLRENHIRTVKELQDYFAAFPVPTEAETETAEQPAEEVSQNIPETPDENSEIEAEPETQNENQNSFWQS